MAPDGDLVEKAQGGDPGAFEALYRAHRPRIQVMVTKRLRNLDDVDDVVQVTFTRAFTALGDFRREATFSTWLTRIAVNTCSNFWREQQRRRKWVEVVDDPEAIPHRRSGPGLADPEETFHRNQIHRTTLDAICGLPARYRKALWMRCVKDLSYREIGRELRVPIGTVKIWLHRARRMLREELQGLNL